MREYVSTNVNGLTVVDDEIVISFYGPRGGLKYAGGLTLPNAEALADRLTRAIARMKNSSIPVAGDLVK